MNPDGTSFDYAYTSTNDLESGKSSEGVQYNYLYDNNGNATSVKAQGSDEFTALTPGKVYYLRLKTLGQYMDVDGGLNEDGRNVQIYGFNGSAAHNGSWSAPMMVITNLLPKSQIPAGRWV